MVGEGEGTRRRMIGQQTYQGNWDHGCTVVSAFKLVSIVLLINSPPQVQPSGVLTVRDTD